MACVVGMAYVVMVCIVMANIVMAYDCSQILRRYAPYIGMACIVMACLGMAHIVPAYIGGASAYPSPIAP